MLWGRRRASSGPLRRHPSSGSPYVRHQRQSAQPSSYAPPAIPVACTSKLRDRSIQRRSITRTPSRGTQLSYVAVASELPRSLAGPPVRGYAVAGMTMSHRRGAAARCPGAQAGTCARAELDSMVSAQPARRSARRSARTARTAAPQCECPWSAFFHSVLNCAVRRRRRRPEG